MGSDELFVTHLNDNSDEIAKPIENYLDLLLILENHMSIRSRLVSQPNKKLKLNSEQCHGLITYYFRCNFTPQTTR